MFLQQYRAIYIIHDIDNSNNIIIRIIIMRIVYPVTHPTTDDLH